MTGVGCVQPRYTLYIRARDGRVLLVDSESERRVPIERLYPLSTSKTTFVKPRGAIGVALMDDEIQHVEEFPALAKRESRRKAG